MALHIAMHPAGHRALTPGRVVVVNNAIFSNAAAIILQPASAATAGITATTQADRYFHCLILVNAKHMNSDLHIQGRIIFVKYHFFAKALTINFISQNTDHCL